MKQTIITLLVLFSFQAFSGEKTVNDSLQEVLMRNDTTLHELQKAGTLLREGEFTGAGKMVFIASIKAFITRDDLILAKDVSHFVSKPNVSPVQTTNDLSAIQWQGAYVEMNQVKAIVISK